MKEKLQDTMNTLLDKIATADSEEVRNYARAYGILFGCSTYRVDPMTEALAERMRAGLENPFDNLDD